MSEDPHPDPAKIGGLGSVAAVPDDTNQPIHPNGERKASDAPVARDQSAEVPVGSGPSAGSAM